MSFALLLPMGLAALAALLLPLLIHLARRSEERVVVFAALRWLQARPQPRRKRRFEEIPLLLLRLLLLAALALLLAEPVLFGQPDRTPWVAVAPGVDTAAARADIEDGQARTHWLTPGFPMFVTDPKAPGAPPVATAATSDTASVGSLLRELDARLPAGTPLTVLVPPVLDGADAERPALSRRVDWRVLPAAAVPDEAAAATTRVPSLPVLMVRHGPARTAPLRYLRAAGIAWQALDNDHPDSDGTTTKPAVAAPTTAAPAAAASPITIATADQPLDPQVRNLIWLVPGALPTAVREWIANGGTALLDAQTQMPEFTADDAPAVVWRDVHGVLARSVGLGRGRALRLERDMVPAVMPGLLEPDFPQQLQRLFVDATPPPARVGADDHAPRTGAAPWPDAPRPLAPWLIVLIAAVFLIERWIANGPRRRAVA